MAFHGVFISVGKFIDPDIPELVGAARNAKALHALFVDTLGDASPLLRVDEDATCGNIRAALSRLEGQAAAGDTVVLYFSGHGSHDHRLATHDTELTHLASTMVSMDEIARFFKNVRASSVLCILDCCFSGGAPAKVLEDSPIPRDPTILSRGWWVRGASLNGIPPAKVWASARLVRRPSLAPTAPADR